MITRGAAAVLGLALAGCFAAHDAAPDGGGSSGDGGDGGGGEPVAIERARVLVGGDVDELRVATLPDLPPVIAASFHQKATWRDPARLASDVAFTPRGGDGAYELVVSGLDASLAPTWITPIWATGAGIDLEDLAAGSLEGLVVVLGETDNPGTIHIGLGGDSIECEGSFLVALRGTDGAYLWSACASSEVKGQRAAFQTTRIGGVGSSPGNSSRDGYVTESDLDGRLLPTTHTVDGPGDDELGVIAPSDGGFITGGVVGGETTGADGLLFALAADGSPGPEVALGTEGAAVDDEVTAVAAGGGLVWVAGTIGGELAWPIGTPTGHQGVAFVAAATPSGAVPERVNAFGSGDGEVKIRALDAAGALTIAGDCRGPITPEEGPDVTCGTAGGPFFARLDGATLAVTEWISLTADPGTTGQVSQLARGGSFLYMAGDWLGTLALPGQSVSAPDQDAFLIEVSGL